MAEDDTELEALFATARQRRDELPDGLATRMLDDSAAVQAERGRPKQAANIALWAQLRKVLGGWPGISGLATAAAAGIWIGISPPDFLPDPAQYLFQQGATDDFAELSLVDLYAEEG